MAEPAHRDSAVAELVQRGVERTLARGLKGLDYIRSSDPAVGGTRKDVLYTRGTLQLYHYHATTDDIYRIPLILIMSLVSKPYILDLAPGQSLVEFLVNEGFDVYMIDWGVPRPEDKSLRVEDYVLDFIPDCLERVAEDSGVEDVSIVGYCMGGMLSVMYAALHTDGPLTNLACFTTPVDFDGMGLFKRWTDPRFFDVDRIVDTLGNVPPEIMYQSFQMLRPASDVAGRIRLWDNMANDDFVDSYRRLDRWAQDQIPFPGECFRQTTKELQQENRLLKKEFELDGRIVDLADITVPFLHVMAEHDHIVPYDAAEPLVRMVSSEDSDQVVLKGGHVSLVAGQNAVRRMWPTLSSWLADRST